jgi:PAS domain-containing protein
MRLPAPHIRRAVTMIGNRFDMKTVEATTFAATVETLTAGVVLADEDSKIVHTNATAAAMLAAGDPIVVRHGRIAVQSATTTSTLIHVQRTIAATRVVASHHPEHSLPIPCASL